MHQLKYVDWQAGSGNWYCNDVSDLSGVSGQWWIPAMMLEITPSAFVEMLIKEYEVDNIKFNGKTLIYSWSENNYSKCHKFVLDINRIARNKKFFC